MPKIADWSKHHNMLILRDVLALFVYRLHFVFAIVFCLTCRCSFNNYVSVNPLAFNWFNLAHWKWLKVNILAFYSYPRLSQPPFLQPYRCYFHLQK